MRRQRMVIKVVRINQKAESSCIIMTTQLPCLDFGPRLTFLKKNATENDKRALFLSL